MISRYHALLLLLLLTLPAFFLRAQDGLPLHPERLWIGGKIAGLNHGQFDIASRSFIPYSQHLAGPQTLASGHAFINAICKDQFNQIWIGTDDGLDRFDADQEAFITYHHDPNDPQSLSHDFVTSIFEDRAGQLWIGTSRAGLNRFDRPTNSFRNYDVDHTNPKSLSESLIRDVFEDRSGVLWVGHGREGLSFADKQQKGFRLLKHDPKDAGSLSDNKVSALYEDRAGGLWIGTQRGLNYYHEETQRFQHYANDWIVSIYEDQKGILWLGTNMRGIRRFDPKNGTFKSFKNDPNDPLSLAGDYVAAFFQSRNGTIWVGSSEGLQQFDEATEKFHHFPLFADENTPPFIDYIYEDHSGFLWIGTNAGLFCLDPQTGRISAFLHDQNDLNTLSGLIVTSIQEDHSSHIWAGTISGLNKIVFPDHGPFESQAVKIRRYTEKDGLPSNDIQGMLEDDNGQLWISSGNGLSVFKNPQHSPSSPPDFRNYGIKDGLPSDGFHRRAFLKNSKGVLFFGGPEGITVFHPDSIQENTFVPPVVITSFEKFDTDFPEQGAVAISGISEKKVVQLSYKDNIFSIDFAALSFRENHLNKYAYQLEGFNDN